MYVLLILLLPTFGSDSATFLAMQEFSSLETCLTAQEFVEKSIQDNYIADNKDLVSNCVKK